MPDRGGPHGERAHVGDQPLGPVLGVDRDPVAGLDAEGEERVPGELDLVPVVRPGHLAPDPEVLVPHRDGVAASAAAWSRIRGDRGCVTGPLTLLAEVGADDVGVPLHLVGRAGGDRGAEVDDHHPVGEVHHQAHVVLDHDDRDVQLVADVEDVAGGVLGLLEVHAGHRLVEQQQLGLHGEGPAQLDALLHAVGQQADGQRAPLLELEEVDDLLDDAAVRRAPGVRARPSHGKAGRKP